MHAGERASALSREDGQSVAKAAAHRSVLIATVHRIFRERRRQRSTEEARDDVHARML